MARRHRKQMTLGGMFIFAVAGIIFLMIGAATLVNTSRYRARCTEESRGTVVEILEHKTTKTNKKTHKKTVKTTYAPVVDYEYNGKKYTFRSTNYTGPGKYSKGQSVTIMINPDSPDQIYISGDNTEYITGSVFAGIGGLFALIGIIGSITMIRKKRMGSYY